MMMREQARNGLQVQLDAAVTNGDAEAARKIAKDLEVLAVSTAPKAPAFTDVDIRAELDKQPWFGTDPKRSAKAVEFGKTLDPKKFASAALFAEALVKAVDEEFKPAGAANAGTGNEEEDDGADEGDDDKGDTKPRKRATDGPGEGDATQRNNTRTAKGPWAKLSDAPGDVQKEINRTADKFAPKTKEGREGYVKRALEAHYASHQRTKGKK
jgi:hypothetical protein